MNRTERVREISEYLTVHGIRPSHPRVRIYAYLQEMKNHPTVDMIYSALHPAMPTLSRTTVYNTMKLFLDKDVVIMVAIEDNEARFDADISDHGHFKCEECGEVFDFRVEAETLQSDLSPAFAVKQRHYYYYGVCAGCI